MEWLTIFINFLTGICKKVLDSQESSSSTTADRSAALCLTVPESAIYDLEEGQPINRERIIKLIDFASEFLCVKIEEADSFSIDILKEKQSPERQLKFYIRIDISNGQNIINKKTLYQMKRDLSPDAEGTIRELGFLQNVSILRQFNRI
jgi:hypothetical protein